MLHLPCEPCSTPCGHPRRMRRAPLSGLNPSSPGHLGRCTRCGCRSAFPPGQRAGTSQRSGVRCQGCLAESGRGVSTIMACQGQACICERTQTHPPHNISTRTHARTHAHAHTHTLIHAYACTRCAHDGLRLFFSVASNASTLVLIGTCEGFLCCSTV